MPIGIDMDKVDMARRECTRVRRSCRLLTRRYRDGAAEIIFQAATGISACLRERTLSCQNAIQHLLREYGIKRLMPLCFRQRFSFSRARR